MNEKDIIVAHVRDSHVPGAQGTVYGGRANGGGMEMHTIGHRGWLGNPWSHNRFGRIPVILMYAAAFDYRQQVDREFRHAVEDLHGKAVQCYCRHYYQDKPLCHVDVIKHFLRGDLDVFVQELTERVHTIPSKEELMTIKDVGEERAENILAVLEGHTD